MSSRCSFCHSPGELVPFAALNEHGCHACVRRLGVVLSELSPGLFLLWPPFGEPEDLDPEPRIRLPDGRSVELRAHTAELKKDLDTLSRAKLAQMYLGMGLLKEALDEVGVVLSGDFNLESASLALTVLFDPRVFNPSAMAGLRAILQPS